MLLVSEAGRKRFPYIVGHLAKRGNATVALALVNGVEPLGNLPSRALAAFSRASARGTLAALPSPISFALPRHVKRSTHLRAPVSETIK